MESAPRFFTPPVDHFFLLGPRGTGKTWWTRTQYPEALRVDLLDPETLRAMAARPERLRERVAGQPGVKQVVIDGEDYPESRRVLLYRGTERVLQDGILCLPCAEFLRTLLPDKFPD